MAVLMHFLSVTRRKRKGTLLAEASMACVIAAVATVGVLQLVFMANQQLRKRENHTLIVREVGNLMEDLCSRSWDELSADDPPVVGLSEVLRKRVPDATLLVDIRREEDRPASLRITLRVEPPPLSNVAMGPVQLVAWRERFEEGER